MRVSLKAITPAPEDVLGRLARASGFVLQISLSEQAPPCKRGLRPAKLEDQEPMRTKFSLTLADARRVVAAAEAEAVENGWSVVIAVVDDGGHLVLLQRLDGTQAASSEIATQKARAAALFKRPTKALEDVVAGGRLAMLSLPGLTAVEGGAPLLYRGDVVGAIGVSGVQSFQDGIVAKAGADSLDAEPARAAGTTSVGHAATSSP